MTVLLVPEPTWESLKVYLDECPACAPEKCRGHDLQIPDTASLSTQVFPFPVVTGQA